MVGARLRTAPGHVLGGQIGVTVLFPLGKGKQDSWLSSEEDGDRLGDDDPSVQFSDGP